MSSIPNEANPLGVGGGKSWSDYIVYVSCGQLTAQSGKADTGQGLTLYNISPSSFKEYGGISCIDMTPFRIHYARLTEPSMNIGPAMPRSYSVWLAPTYSSYHMRGIAIGSYAANRELCSPNNYSWTYEICAGGHSVNLRTGKYLKANVWSHIVQNYFADGTIDIWLNGERIGHFTGQSIDIQSPLMSLGAATDSTSDPYRGYVSTARLWNRTLEDSEIKDLSEELQPMYTISAQDLSFSLYQKTETYGISYSSPMSPVTFEIVEGELPPEISFDASTGKFTGKGPTDDDHVYTLKVKLSAPDSYSAICTVRISTYKTARISFTSQSLSFITEGESSADISFTADEPVTFEIVQGELPAGVSLTGSTVHSTGEQTSAQEKTAVLRAKSAHNQEGVTASVTFSVILNRITLSTSGVRLYTGSAGPSSKRLLFYSQRSISPVWSIEGSLPAGVTFDAENGVMRGDSSSYGESSTVTVTVASSTGRSAPATAEITVETLESLIIPSEYAVYIPMSGLYADSPASDVTVVNQNGSYPVTFSESGGVSYGTFGPTHLCSLTVSNVASCFPYKAISRTVSFWIRRQLRDSDATILWYGNSSRKWEMLLS